MATILFVTHREVVIDPAILVPDWPLSDLGRRRMIAFAQQLQEVAAIYTSAELKARDGGAIITERFGLASHIDERLGENDRSATGYIAPLNFGRSWRNSSCIPNGA